jgi:hypothetical protein
VRVVVWAFQSERPERAEVKLSRSSYGHSVTTARTFPKFDL